MPEEEGKIHPAVVIGIGLGLALATAGAVYALTRLKAPPTPPPGLANLYGRVTDAETGKGLSDILVTLDTEYVYTDKDGYYAFLNLEPRDYPVMFSKEGYKTIVLRRDIKEGNNELNAALWPYMLAELLLDGLRVTWTGAYEDKIVVGDTVHVWARAQNTGTEPGSWQITWRVGEKIQTELLELEGKQIKQIAFTYFVPESPGVYQIEVDGLTGSFEVVEELVKPVAIITSVELDKTTVRQGGDITVHAHIQSNFSGTAWIVFAHGRGTPSPGAGFRALYNVQGDYLGWFPSGFDFVRFDPYTTGVNVGGMDLKVGDNSVSHTFGLRRNLPLGEYTIYVGVVPPAANWYQWDEPYDWAISTPFTVLEEAPRIRLDELEFQVTQKIKCLRDGGDIKTLNRDLIKGITSPLVQDHIDLPFVLFGDEGLGFTYRKTWSVGETVYWQDMYYTGYIPDGVSEPEICINIMASPPEDRYGRVTKVYEYELTIWVTYPDGHTVERTIITQSDPVSGGARTKCWLTPEYFRATTSYALVTSENRGLEEDWVSGKYKVRMRLVADGIFITEKIGDFTIL